MRLFAMIFTALVALLPALPAGATPESPQGIVQLTGDSFLVWSAHGYRTQQSGRRATMPFTPLDKGETFSRVVGRPGGAFALATRSEPVPGGYRSVSTLLLFDGQGTLTRRFPLAEPVVDLAVSGDDALLLTFERLLRFSPTGHAESLTTTQHWEHQLLVDAQGRWILCRGFDLRKEVHAPDMRAAHCRSQTGYAFDAAFSSVRPLVCGAWLVEPVETFQARTASAVHLRALNDGQVIGTKRLVSTGLSCLDGRVLVSMPGRRHLTLPALAPARAEACGGRLPLATSGNACLRKDGVVGRLHLP
jgi:hypothetical protein